MTTPPHRAKIVVALPLAPSLLGLLGDYDLTVVPPASRARLRAAAITDAVGVLVSSSTVLDRRVIASAPALRVISTMSVGVDHIDLEEARRRGITVTITPVLSDAVADLAMALIVMLARRIPDAMRAVAGGAWSKVPLGASVAGKELLVVGFGRIGQAVAARAGAARMNVTAVDTGVESFTMGGVRRAGSLREAMPDADVVSLHVDLNPTTRHMIGADELALMKPSAFLVNTSRGGVVDQAALTTALHDGRIAGAGLDVLEEEPPDRDEPLLRAPNVIVLPHVGSATVETREAMARCAVDNLVAALRGEWSPFAVS